MLVKTSWEKDKKLIHMACNVVCTEKSRTKKKILSGRHVLYSSPNDLLTVPPEILSLGFPPSCGDIQSQSISLVSRTGQNIIYQDFSSIYEYSYKRIVYSKSKRLEMLDLLKKKDNCAIFAAKIKA